MIPFSLVPEKPLYAISRHFLSTGSFLSSFFPNLDLTLKQAEYSYSAREYASMSFAAALINAIFMLVGLVTISYLLQRDLLAVILFLCLCVFFVSFSSIIFYPGMRAARRAQLIEHNLIYAVRQILIELRSGVTLFSALASVTTDYEETSKEFAKIVNKIESGAPELDVLAEASTTSPSPGMRKVLWQVSNALKVGSDISSALDSQVQDLMKERIEQIRKYGQELSPWTMMYLLGAVIFPSLGVTMLIVLTTFINTPLPDNLFLLLSIFLAGFQVFFMHLVSSRRPLI